MHGHKRGKLVAEDSGTGKDNRAKQNREREYEERMRETEKIVDGKGDTIIIQEDSPSAESVNREEYIQVFDQKK